MPDFETHPIGTADRLKRIDAARAEHDAAIIACPFSKAGRGPPVAKPCKVCQAGRSEPCRRQVTTAFGCADAIRASVQ